MNTDNDIESQNLLGEKGVESETKLVQQYIKMNQEEHLRLFLKIDGQLSVPKLQRCATYCAPKLDQSLREEDLVEDFVGDIEDLKDLEDLKEDIEDLGEDLPTLKKDDSGLVILGLKEFFEREDQQEHAPPMFKKGLVVVIDPADWVGRAMPAYKNSEFGVRYVMKGDV